MLISVVVPVYNVEQYISKCIESVIAQTYTDWELILIDDGSSDESFAICSRYAQQDNRIKVVHQKNQGVSAARNKGIECAKGEYITFIDSDDYVTPVYLSDMASFDSDIIASGFTLWYAHNNETRIKTFEQHGFYSESLGNFSEALIIGELNHLWKGPCTKLFRKTLIDNHKIRFNETLSYGEDHLFVMSLLKEAKSVTILPISNYIYTHYGNTTLTNRRVPYGEMFQYIASIDNLRMGIISSKEITHPQYHRFCDKELISYFWQTIYTLYRTQPSKAQRKAAINEALNTIRSKALEIVPNLAPTYSIMNLMYRIFPFCISDLINRKLATRNE